MIIASIVSIVVEEVLADDAAERETAWLDGFAIMLAVIICAFVSAFNNYEKEKQFQELQEVADKRKEVNISQTNKKTSR